MRIPWDLFFAMFSCFAAVLFAAAGWVTLFGKCKRFHLLVAAAALGSMALALLAGIISLGHPERIFGAFANPNSVLSRELIAIFASFIIMATFVYQLYRNTVVSKAFSVIAMLFAVAFMVTTVQLIRVWTSDALVIGTLSILSESLISIFALPVLLT